MSDSTGATVFIYATTSADTGHLVPLLKEAGCAHALTIRHQAGYSAGSFDPSRYAALIILGNGKHSADDKHAFAAEKAWIRAALDSGRPFLGVCLGAQLLVHVAGGRIHHGNQYVDKGLTELALTKDGKVDPVVCVTQRALVYQQHKDTFAVPEKAVHLAHSTTARPRPRHSDAFRIGDNAYGLQFHPEPTATMLRQWLTMLRRWLPADTSAEDVASAEGTGQAVLRAGSRLPFNNM